MIDLMAALRKSLGEAPDKGKKPAKGVRKPAAKAKAAPKRRKAG